MKRLNNKGFAISTILYSLLIMVFLIVALLMGIMSSNRQNTKALINTIEDELNRYSLTSTEFLPSGTTTATAQEYIVPYGQAGWYKIELWGAAGGTGSSSTLGGAGAYTSGIIYLEENTLIFFYIGGMGSGTTGGINGGGNGNGNGRGGGGATDVRLLDGEWNDEASLKSRIMVAGGGGGAYTTTKGQNAGTLEAAQATVAVNGSGGTQVAGGTKGTSANDGALGIGGAGVSGGSGGGGGYYGGGGAGSNGLGGGGSSFISGYAGVAVNGNYEITKANNLYFIDGMMAENVNTGTGKAKIELISTNSRDNPPTKKTTKLDNVRYIKDCVSGVGTSTAPQWTEIQAMQNGENKAYNSSNSLTNGELTTIVNTTTESGTETSTIYGTLACQTVDLGATYNLDEIAVWHNASSTTTAAERVLSQHTIYVSSDQTNWQYLRKVGSLLSEESQTGPEEISGTHISAWDPDSESALPNGTYYIFSALAPNSRLLTAQNSLISSGGSIEGSGSTAAQHSRPVSLKQIDGTNLQKWTITQVDVGGVSYYKIVEKESQQALQISDNLAQAGSQVNTSSTYSDVYDWTQWRIISLGDGTYRIKPKTQPSTDELQYTYLASDNGSYDFTASALVLSTYSANALSQRFYIVSAE